MEDHVPLHTAPEAEGQVTADGQIRIAVESRRDPLFVRLARPCGTVLRCPRADCDLALCVVGLRRLELLRRGSGSADYESIPGL